MDDSKPHATFFKAGQLFLYLVAWPFYVMDFLSLQFLGATGARD